LLIGTSFIFGHAQLSISFVNYEIISAKAYMPIGSAVSQFPPFMVLVSLITHMPASVRFCRYQTKAPL
jgi:hypothetical protein